MRDWVTGKGKFGLKIVDHDGSKEEAWFTTQRDRDKAYKNLNGSPEIKTIDRIKRK